MWVIYAVSSTGWVDWENVATGECMDDSSQYGLRLFGCNLASFESGYQAWND
jgi:hypothetical protein